MYCPISSTNKVSSVLFRILGIGAGPSELGKLARKLYKLGNVETYRKYFKYKTIEFK